MRARGGLSLFQQVDAFFNYLFHEHQEKPSNQYSKIPARKLNKSEQVKQLTKYFKHFKKWLGYNPSFENYRANCIKTIHRKFSVSNIDKIKHADAEEVINCLHCMNSLPLNKTRFLNPKNNSLNTIKIEWERLLRSQTIGLEERMVTCDRNLRFFGKSSIRELIGWFYPEEYPIVNTNSNSGMKFFGYNLKPY